MGTIRFPSDFKEFLRLLRFHGVEYLLVGGYAVAYHGYPRATGDMDIWIHRTPANAERVVGAMKAFGFDSPDLKPSLFLADQKNIRMGVPPLRIEILTGISGVEFEACYASRIVDTFEEVEGDVISRQDLLANKRAAARHKDLTDLENLPPGKN